MLKQQTQPLVVQLDTESTAGWSVWCSLLHGREVLVIKPPKLSAGAFACASTAPNGAV